MNYIEEVDTKWDLHNWICQILFFIVVSLCFFQSVISGTHGDTSLWYYYGAIGSITVSSVGVALPHPTTKNIFSLSMIMANVFIIPLVLFSSGYSLGFSAGVSLIYVICIGAISPYLVAIGTGIAAITLSCYLHFDNNVFRTLPEFKQNIIKQQLSDSTDTNFEISIDEPILYKVEKEKTTLHELSLKHYGSEDYSIEIYNENKDKFREDTPNDLLLYKDMELIIPNIKQFNFKAPIIISLLYIIAVALGIGWKVYILKMLQLSRSAMGNNSGESENEILNLKDELELSNNNCRLLKEEVAIQIIEMNQLSELK